MKNAKIFSICLMFMLFNVFTTNAQNAVLSGSFQFTNEINQRVGIITLQSGSQKFEMPISENIIIANLLPGRYLLTVEFQSGGRGGQMTKISQNIDIDSERRTICRMNASAVLVLTKEYDRNSLPLLESKHNDRNQHFDNHDRRDDHRNVQHPAPMPISELDFNNLYNSVQNEKFSDTKMRTLKTSSNFHPYFSSEQVKRLAMLFTNDNDKLECVKHLAPKVLDAQNLPFIKDVFTFNTTKEDYLKFLNKR